MPHMQEFTFFKSQAQTSYVGHVRQHALQQPQKIFAKAIYDNIAECPEEMAFKKGDILTVIALNADGIEGWWLCALRGRQGICPGNRLQIISYDNSSPISSPLLNQSSLSLTTSHHDGSNNTNTSSSGDLYGNRVSSNTRESQQNGKRRSWHIMPNRVVTPQKYGDVYLYDLLPSPTSGRCLLNSRTPVPAHVIMSNESVACSETYDTPRPINYDTPRTMQRSSSRSDDSYDIPRPLNETLGHQVQQMHANSVLSPSSSNSSLLTSDSLSLSSSNRSSLANMPDYDIPRRNPQSVRGGLSLAANEPAPPETPVLRKELPLELSFALEMLAKLQNEANTAVSRFLGFVSPNWRLSDRIEPVIMDLKLATVRMRTALHDLAEFGDGALGNAARAKDKGIVFKLRPLVAALRDADKLIHNALQYLELQGWTVESLARSSKDTTDVDWLDQTIACAKTLIEDMRQTASFIQGNAPLLFKRSSTTTTTTPVANVEWPDEYDYVSLESKEAVESKHAAIRDALPQDLQRNFENVVRNAHTTAAASEPLPPQPSLGDSTESEMDAADKSLLVYYASQTVTHMSNLTQAIDAFLKTVERNQPPKFFLAHGKFVVLSAHNLVNIGDIVHRNVSRSDVRVRILQCSDALNDSMKSCVANTKRAAQHFPSVTAVQEMVDSVVDLSHLAADLKLVMLQAIHY